MPEISRFYGIIVRMYPGDHPPPHFHAIYAEHEAFIEIATGTILYGYIPGTAYIGPDVDAAPRRRIKGTLGFGCAIAAVA